MGTQAKTLLAVGTLLLAACGGSIENGNGGSRADSGADDPAAQPPGLTAESIPQSADELGFEPGTFMGSMEESLDESFDEPLDEFFDEFFDVGGEDRTDEVEVLLERIEFVAGDKLTGAAEFMVQGPGASGGPSDGDGLACIYVKYEMSDVELVDSATGLYSGTGRMVGNIKGNACPGGGQIAVDEFHPLTVSARVEGDTLTVTIGVDVDALTATVTVTLTATRVGS